MFKFEILRSSWGSGSAVALSLALSWIALVPSPAGASDDTSYPCGPLECFRGCGTLIGESENCGQLFQDDGGQVYALENAGGFQPGDRVFVHGIYNPFSSLCQPVPMPGIEQNTIAPCFQGCGTIVADSGTCHLFQADLTGELYALENLGEFGVGDHVIVEGGIQWFSNFCPSFSQPAVVDNSIAWCFPDADADGVADEEDCAPNDPSAYSVPGEVTEMDWPSLIDTQWDAPSGGPGIVFDVVRGQLEELPVGSGTFEECLVSGTAEQQAEDDSIPLPGEGYWYLVRGHNVCGAGPWGYASDGAEEAPAACP